MSKILVIEDDEETALLLREALSDIDHDVDVCTNGADGIRRIQSSLPDLVICDVRMPQADGFEVLEQLSAAMGSAVPPFVFLTALADRDSEINGRRLGADDYLTKPVDFEMLALVIDNRLRRTGRAQTQQSELQLTAREHEVLTWVGRGKTSGEIATILGVRERTINFHCDQAIKRLDVTNRTQAVAKAITLGLIGM
jgi:DNA-binding NarL/FixJ family response regulator